MTKKKHGAEQKTFLSNGTYGGLQFEASKSGVVETGNVVPEEGLSEAVRKMGRATIAQLRAWAGRSGESATEFDDDLSPGAQEIL